MGDWDHMNGAVSFGQWIIWAIAIVALIALPLAIWKILDLFC